MKKIILLLLIFSKGFIATAAELKNAPMKDGTDILELSQQLLLAAKLKEPTDSLVALMKAIPESALTQQLTNDDRKKAFWINVYNAFTQVSLTKNPDKYKNRGSFFGEKQIEIAGRTLSLDQVEHGILRHSKIKWSLGHLNKLFPGRFEKQQRVDTLDYRIHFALNCGAKSCPPIAFYGADQLDRQLDLATNAYLKGDVEYNAVENTVSVPALMGWFRGDFGGKDDMLLLLKKLNIVPADKNPKIKFSDYNWDLFLENYKAP